ncbi:hypothetical protein LEP3755_26860 [Leptolyngbya sp. NIES-3755]|nr:hypothetical protein LEP3755_26860 [Leptolyngbya sp. NIES-3755]
MSQDRQVATDTSDRVKSDAYDPHIVPAETAARMEREGGEYKTTPTEEREASAPTDDQTDPESIHTTDGYTVDQEGLLNNYAIEPEMYYEVPGDARQAEEELHQERVEEYRDINQDESGKLTMEDDKRGHGSGAV